MSTSMYWRPVPPPPAENGLSSDLKMKIRDHMFHGDWPYGSSTTIGVRDGTMIAFLHGLAACGVEDADVLLKLISEHKMIEIWVGDPDGPR